MLLRKGVYSYEYMDSWQRFDEISLPDKEVFYSNLNMEDITDFEKLGGYHDLYVKSDTLLLADIF